MIGSPFAPLAREHCPPTKGESSSQAKLFDNDRHFWYTCASKSGLMTPPVPRGSRELTPVEAKGRANLNGNQGGQSPRKQEPTFVRTGNPVSVYGTGGCQKEHDWSPVAKRLMWIDMYQICLILRSICSGFPLCGKRFALKQTQAPLSMIYLQWDDGYESHRQEYSLFS